MAKIDETYKELQPKELWQHFTELNKILRCSGQEMAVQVYVQQVADAAGVPWKVDESNNIVVYVPTRVADSDAPIVAIQAHLDMVCEKQPDVTHDFASDTIRPRRDGDRIFASGTTLGADDGIGVAAALALLTRPDLKHGPLELIFTVEEEIGLRGALGLDPSLLNARFLINLDSQDPNKLTIGSAGAEVVTVHFSPTTETMPPGCTGREVVISGLKGGHSGLQIHERIANSIKLLTRALIEIQGAGVGFSLCSLEGGSTHNAIPRTAAARLCLTPGMVPKFETAVAEMISTLRAEWVKDEPEFRLEVRDIPAPNQGMADQSGDLLLRLLDDIPHGALAMSESFPGVVETSSNLAYVQTKNNKVEILTSSRSFSDTALRGVQSRIRTLGQAVGARVEVQECYPGWQPDLHSRLLELAKRTYLLVNAKPAELRVTHGGLECGVIASKVPGMEAISIGPLISGAHTPEESVYASTVASTWELLAALLEALCDK